MNQSRLDRLSLSRPCPRKSGRGFLWAAAAVALLLGMAVPSALAQTTNHAPVGTSNTVILAEDTSYGFAAADFGFTDPNDSPANGFLAVKITTLPAAGTLTSGGNAVTNGQWVSSTEEVGVHWMPREISIYLDLGIWSAVASSADGTKLVAAVQDGQLYTSQDGLDLTFTPAPDGHGSPYGSFTFQVQDDGGTANGGVDLDPTPKTMTLAVTSTPLWWLAGHGITGDFEEAVNGDPDQDGIPTGDEWVMDTDPTNGASFLAFDAVWPLYGNCWDVVSTNKEPPYEVVTNQECELIGHVFQWRTSTGRVYGVQGAAGMHAPWLDLDGMTNLQSPDAELSVTNLATDPERMRHYRVRVRLP